MAKKLSRIATFNNDKRGNVAITFGLTIIPAVMMVGGAIDFGQAYKTKHRIQNAADAAVLAGTAMPAGTTTQARRSQALSVFTANLNGISGVTPVVTVSTDGKTVSIQANGSVNTSFLKLAHLDTLNVGGAASSTVVYTTTTSTSTETTTGEIGRACLLALDPNATNGLISQGTPNVNYAGCWAHTNSASASAIAGGGSASVVGAGHSAVGGVTSNATGVYSPAAVGGAAVIADPFATVGAYVIPYSSYTPTFTPPAIPSDCKASNLSLKRNEFTLQPGRYCGGINIQAGATVTFEPGVYIIDNGEFNVQSGSTVTGTNVLFYYSGAAARFTIIGGGSVNLKGRQNGSSYAGFVFIAHPNAWRGLTSNIQGGGTFNMEGMVYAPTQNVLITGNGTANTSSNFFALVAKSFEFRGNGIFNYKNWNSASNMPNIMPVKTAPVTTTVTTTVDGAINKTRLN